MIDICVECGSGTYAPQTIVFDTNDNAISGCYGALNFGAAGNTFAVEQRQQCLQRHGPHQRRQQAARRLGYVQQRLPRRNFRHVSFRLMPTGYEVMVSWAFDIAANTALHTAMPPSR